MGQEAERDEKHLHWVRFEDLVQVRGEFRILRTSGNRARIWTKQAQRIPVAIDQTEAGKA